MKKWTRLIRFPDHISVQRSVRLEILIYKTKTNGKRWRMSFEHATLRFGFGWSSSIEMNAFLKKTWRLCLHLLSWRMGVAFSFLLLLLLHLLVRRRRRRRRYQKHKRHFVQISKSRNRWKLVEVSLCHSSTKRQIDKKTKGIFFSTPSSVAFAPELLRK